MKTSFALRITILTGTLWTLSLSPTPSVGFGVAQAKSRSDKTTVVKAFVMRVRDPETNSPPHGNVYFIYKNGRKVRMTLSGMCQDPQVAPGGKVCGWVEGHFTNWEGSGLTCPRMFVSTHIVVFKGGRRTSSFVPEAAYRTTITELCFFQWRFIAGGRRVIVDSVGSHGQHYYQMFDANTGKQVGRTVRGAKPTWAKGLPGDY